MKKKITKKGFVPIIIIVVMALLILLPESIAFANEETKKESIILEIEESPKAVNENKHEVIYMDYTGTVELKRELVNDGEAANPPSTPNRKNFSFKGWGSEAYRQFGLDTILDLSTINDNLTVFEVVHKDSISLSFESDKNGTIDKNKNSEDWLLRGDVDLDKTIDFGRAKDDYRLINDHLGFISRISGKPLLAADINHDGIVNVSDIDIQDKVASGNQPVTVNGTTLDIYQFHIVDHPALGYFLENVKIKANGRIVTLSPDALTSAGYSISKSNDGNWKLVGTIKDNMDVLFTHSNEKPIIDISDKTLLVGEKYDPKTGVIITDREDGEIQLTDENITSNNVDTSKPGNYKVTYKVQDKGGNIVEKTITINVKADTKPMLDATDKVIKEGSTFNPRDGVTAYDDGDGNLTDKITYTGNVDTSKPGDYKITYKVQDSDGNIVEKTIIITVEGKELLGVTKPSTPDNNQNKGEIPKTMDEEIHLIYLGTMGISLGALMFIFLQKKQLVNKK